MARVRQFGSALMVAIMLAGGVATLEAKGKKGGGGDAQTALCSYLNDVITYPYVTYAVQQYALYLWDQAGCAALN